MPKFREITGQFVGYVPDSIDPDFTPDREPMNGLVKFTPVYTGGVIAFPELSPPEFAKPQPIYARIIDGFVRVEVLSGGGEESTSTMQPLHLMVTVDDEATQVWSWRAEFSNITLGQAGEEVEIPSWSFRVPDGVGPIDLAEMLPVKSSTGGALAKGPRGAGLQNITAVDGQLVFAYTDGEESIIDMPDAVQGPEGPEGPRGPRGEVGPQGEKGDPGETPDLLVGNIADATPTGKNLMLAATEGAARNALGLQSGATASNGSLSELNAGTSSTPRVWTADNIATYATGRAQGLVDAARTVVNAKDFGAVGDGVANDTAAIQDAINSAAARGLPAIIPGGRYKITSPLALPTGANLTLETSTVIDGTGLGTSYALSASGSFTSAQALTTDLAKGGQSITVDTAAAFKVGDIVRIRSEHQPDTSQPKTGEIGVVDTVTSDTIGLAAGVLDSYTVADTATIERMTGADSISVTGGTWIGSGANGAKWATFTACTRVRISGVTAKGWKERGLNFYSCADVSVTSCSIDGSDQTGLGYSINISNASAWVVVMGSTFSRFRQAVAGGGGSNDYGRNRFVRIIGNSFHGNRGVNSHSGGQFWIISNNHFQSGASYAAGSPIAWNGAEVTVSNNVFVNSTSVSIVIQPTHFSPGGVIVAGNHVIRAGSTGIAVLAATTQIKSITVANNIVESSSGQGIYLHAADAPGTVSNFSITGNSITDSGAHGIDVYAANGTISGGTVSGNRVTVVAGRTAIRLLAAGGNELSRVAITGNSVSGGTIGIAGNSVTTGCWVDSNLALGSSSGISGFAPGDMGTNRTT